MAFRITVKVALTAEEPVKPVQHALMGFRIKRKLALTAEDHVMPAQLALMGFRIKVKLVLTAEDPVLLVVRKNMTLVEIDISDSFNIRKFYLSKIYSFLYHFQ